MKDPLPIIIPLTEDEKNWLMLVYTLRLEDLRKRYVFNYMFALTLVFVFALWMGAFFHNIFFYTIRTWFHVDYFFSYLGIKIALILGITAFKCLTHFQVNILPYKKDALSGVKQRTSFKVISKEYYGITDQYFVRLNENGGNMYELNKADYDSCDEGGVIVMNQAINSKYIFAENDHAIVKFGKLEVTRRGSGYNGVD